MSVNSRNSLDQKFEGALSCRLDETQSPHKNRISTSEPIKETDNPSGAPSLEIKIAVKNDFSAKPCSRAYQVRSVARNLKPNAANKRILSTRLASPQILFTFVRNDIIFRLAPSTP